MKRKRILLFIAGVPLLLVLAIYLISPESIGIGTFGLLLISAAIGWIAVRGEE